MDDKRPFEKMDEVMEGLGKQPRLITIMIPVTKIIDWFKKRRKRDEKKNTVHRVGV